MTDPGRDLDPFDQRQPARLLQIVDARRGSRPGRRLSRVQLAARFYGHARPARIGKSVHPHALRHACTAHLLKGGADIRHVQALLGHRRIETTALYTRVVAADP